MARSCPPETTQALLLHVQSPSLLCERQAACTHPGPLSHKLVWQGASVLKVQGGAQMLNGQAVEGSALADLLVRMIAALNARDIPTAGSILEHFNQELAGRVREGYAAALAQLKLPVEEDVLVRAADAAKAQALDKCAACCGHAPAGCAHLAGHVGAPSQPCPAWGPELAVTGSPWGYQHQRAGTCRFEGERFGASSSPHLQALRDTLEAGLVRELAAHQNANALASSQVGLQASAAWSPSCAGSQQPCS